MYSYFPPPFHQFWTKHTFTISFPSGRIRTRVPQVQAQQRIHSAILPVTSLQTRSQTYPLSFPLLRPTYPLADPMGSQHIFFPPKHRPPPPAKSPDTIYPPLIGLPSLLITHKHPQLCCSPLPS